MSLRQIQTKNFLEFILSSYLASGKKPTDTEVRKALSFYFSKQPAGAPIQLGSDLFRSGAQSDIDSINDFMAAVQVNLEVLFQQIDEHLDQNILLTTVMMTQMRALKTKRKKLTAKVEDALLSTYNSDGFFYSISDDFFSTELIDFNYTDAFVDVESGIIELPSNPDQTKNIEISGGNSPSISVSDRMDITKTIAYEEKTSFENAVDGLTNTAWYLKIRRPQPSNGVFVRMILDVNLSPIPQFRSSARANTGTEITQVTIIPHGVTPIQCSVEKVTNLDTQTSNTQPFSSYIKTSTEKMVFANENIGPPITRLIFGLTKSEPDYYENEIDGTRSSIYIVGIKELMVTQQAYDHTATFVSQPLSIPSDWAKDQVIGAVSLTVKQSEPSNTTIKYYVAPDNDTATGVSDFQWQEIKPIDELSSSNVGGVIDMSGAKRNSFMIRNESRDPYDLPLMPINESSSDPGVQNPSPSMFLDFSVYRITSFLDNFLTGTITLEEGINSTRISHTDFSDQNMTDTFGFWKTKFDTPGSYESTYGEIDNGRDFFDGADVAENDRSVYIETFIYMNEDEPVTLRNISKANPNSKLWDVKVYLNGREVADMPAGIDKIATPMKLNRGKNSLITAVNIPAQSQYSFSPHLGSLSFNVLEFGTIKLGDFIYVDEHKFKDNGYRDATNVSANKWFTIYNNEIISKSKLTNNYRLRYAKPTGNAPDAVRVRADFSRFEQYNKISPILDSYRLRFSYMGEEV